MEVFKKLFLLVYLLWLNSNFLPFVSKIWSNSLQLHSRYGAISTHWVKILIYDLGGEVHYQKHLNLLLQFFHPFKTSIKSFSFIIGPLEVLIKKDVFFIMLNSFLVIKFLYLSPRTR